MAPDLELEEPQVPALAPAYAPSGTVEDFLLATAAGPYTEMRLLILEGSRGEGKTTGAIWAYLALAERILADGRASVLPIKVGLVRDTFQNIQRTTIDAFRQAAAKGLDITFADQNREALISSDGRVMVHVFFFGLDNARDADKLQGFQCGILHLEEVAPAASMSAGVPAEALGLGNTSVRQEGIPPRILVTMNPPDEDHWIVTIEKVLEEMGLADVVVKRFVIKPGEKGEHFRLMAQEAATKDEYDSWIESATVFDAYRDRSRAFLEAIGRGDLVTRLVGGQRGMVQEGETVVRSYSRELHLAKRPLQIYQHMPIIRGWDAGLTPSTVWVQPTPRGNLNLLGSRITVGGGMEAHILNQVIPFERKYGLTSPHGTTGRGFGRGAKGGFTFRDIGDPACLSGNQTKGEQTVAWLIEDMLGTHFEPGPVEWSARREALNSAFSRKGDGDRMFIMLDPDETRSADQSANLEVSLNGRFHYPKHPVTGRILGTIEAAKRASGIYAQEVDSLAYILAVMFPAQEWLRKKLREATPAPRTSGHSPKTFMGH